MASAEERGSQAEFIKSDFWLEPQRMEATAVLVDRPMEAPIIPEIAMSGLELLTEVLMDVQPAAADAIISLPLPEPLPPEDIENNSENHQRHEEEELEKQEQEGLEDSESHQAASELLPPVLPNEHTAEHPEHSEIGDISNSVTNNGVVAGNSSGGDIAAYFALEFLDMQYIYYLQRSAVSLGRSSNDPNIVGADIDLGPLKNISRLHARIEYEEELQRFVLAIIGRNGAYVNLTWKGPGTRIPLGDRYAFFPITILHELTSFFFMFIEPLFKYLPVHFTSFFRIAPYRRARLLVKVKMLRWTMKCQRWTAQ